MRDVGPGGRAKRGAGRGARNDDVDGLPAGWEASEGQGICQSRVILKVEQAILDAPGRRDDLLEASHLRRRRE